MRTYELMAIFPLDDEKSKKGIEELKTLLGEFGAEIEKEDLFGDRDLTYEIEKQKRGRFMLYVVKLNPAKLQDVTVRLKLNAHLLKFMFVKIGDEKSGDKS